MIKPSAAGRVGTPDEIAATAAFLMGRAGAFISGSDLLIDGGVIASTAAGRTRNLRLNRIYGSRAWSATALSTCSGSVSESWRNVVNQPIEALATRSAARTWSMSRFAAYPSRNVG